MTTRLETTIFSYNLLALCIGANNDYVLRDENPFVKKFKNLIIKVLSLIPLIS